jgi:hypothetical protein
MPCSLDREQAVFLDSGGNDCYSYVRGKVRFPQAATVKVAFFILSALSSETAAIPLHWFMHVAPT